MRVAVVGTGLMGASVGLAAKRAGADHVAGYDGDPEALRVAAERGAVDEPAGSMEAAVAEADLVVVAVPVTQLAAQVQTVLEAAPERATVTDVGSTKAWGAGLGDRYVGAWPCVRDC
jgi:prephenate dehydrogenase